MALKFYFHRVFIETELFKIVKKTNSFLTTDDDLEK